MYLSKKKGWLIWASVWDRTLIWFRSPFVNGQVDKQLSCMIQQQEGIVHCCKCLVPFVSLMDDGMKSHLEPTFEVP